jgi:autotransporter passenger strand-loop-strand repeat protein
VAVFWSFPPAASLFRLRSTARVSASIGAHWPLRWDRQQYTINSGGQEGIFAGGTNIGATVSSGGGLFAHNGLASRTTLAVVWKSCLPVGRLFPRPSRAPGHWLQWRLANLGGIDIATVINNNAHAGVFSGGTDIGAIVNNGGVLYVHSGAPQRMPRSNPAALRFSKPVVLPPDHRHQLWRCVELNGALPSSVTYKPGAILEVGPAAVLKAVRFRLASPRRSSCREPR